MLFSRVSKYGSLSIAFLLAACSGSDGDRVVESDLVSTRQIYATIQVVSDGNGEVYAEAQLTKDVPPRDSVNSDTFILLTDNDELWLSEGEGLGSVDLSDDLFGELVELNDRHVLFESAYPARDIYYFIFDQQIINDFGARYSAVLPEPETSTFSVSLLRDGRSSSTESVVTLPPNFSFVSPVSGGSFSRSEDDLVIEWTNIDNESSIEIEINISCTGGGFYSYSELLDEDLGTYTISAGDLDMPELEGTCSATLNTRKNRLGQFDAGYVGGTVNGYQIRRIVFRSTT